MVSLEFLDLIDQLMCQVLGVLACTMFLEMLDSLLLEQDFPRHLQPHHHVDRRALLVSKGLILLMYKFLRRGLLETLPPTLPPPCSMMPKRPLVNRGPHLRSLQCHLLLYNQLRDPRNPANREMGETVVGDGQKWSQKNLPVLFHQKMGKRVMVDNHRLLFHQVPPTLPNMCQNHHQSLWRPSMKMELIGRHLHAYKVDLNKSHTWKLYS